MAVTESNGMSPAGTNFREMDDASLQTQTRIWLGEVLQIRFDEHVNISDILADGELLFEVSEVISRRYPSLTGDATQLKANEWKSLASSKSTRRYMPYYNVGSFLRLCTNLGVDSIDLFSPSDVVEKRNTRKVCMCLRSLSKKLKSQDPNVPDFDSVTCTLTMPTDMVEGIRKSLELSQSSPSLSVGHDPEKSPRLRYWQRMSNSTSTISNGYSDICDDAESSFRVAESNGLSENACDATSPTTPAMELNLKMGNLDNDEDLQCEYLSPSVVESVGSPCSEYYSDQELSGLESQVDGVVNSEVKPKIQISDVNHVPIDWGDSFLDVWNYGDGNGKNKGQTYHEFSDKESDSSCCYGSPTSENNMPDVHVDDSAHLSEIECEISSFDKIEQLHCENSISYGERVPSLPRDVVQDVFCADEAPKLKLESRKVEQVVYDTAEHGAKDEQMDDDTAKYGDDICGLSPGIGRSFSDPKIKDMDVSSELHVESTNHIVDVHAIDSSGMDLSSLSSIVAGNDGMKCSEDSQEVWKGSEDQNVPNGSVNGKAINIEDATSVNNIATTIADPLPRADSHGTVDELTDNDTAKHGTNDQKVNDESAKPGDVIGGLIPEDKSSTDVKFKDIEVSNELLVQGTPHVSTTKENPDCAYNDENGVFQTSTHLQQPVKIPSQVGKGNSVSEISTEVSSFAVNSCCDSLDSGNAASEDWASSELLPGRYVSVSSDIQENKEEEAHANVITSGSDTERHSDSRVLDGHGSHSTDMDLTSSTSVIVGKDNAICSEDSELVKEEPEDQYRDVLSGSINAKLIKIEDETSVNNFATAVCDPLPRAESPATVEDTNHGHHQVAKNMEGESEHKDTDKEVSESKTQRKLLKTVMKGTAVVGLTVFLLHLRKNFKANMPKVKKQLSEALITSTPTPSSQKGQKKGGTTSNVYPAKKLNLSV